jgi:hypothetical protein
MDCKACGRKIKLGQEVVQIRRGSLVARNGEGFVFVDEEDLGIIHHSCWELLTGDIKFSTTIEERRVDE